MTKTTDKAGTAERLATIRARIERARARFGPPPADVTLVAVSKTFGPADVQPLLEAGQRVFGENRVQEAKGKWPGLRDKYPDVELHLIGPLQTNKVKEAVALFDVIETVDRDKLAKSLAEEMEKTGRRLPCFVQVNIGNEPQKSGVLLGEAAAFVERCRKDYGLDVVGLMGIPPLEVPPGPYFALLAGQAKQCGLGAVSMGMSADFETAIEMGATHVRVGSALFGVRTAHPPEN